MTSTQTHDAPETMPAVVEQRTDDLTSIIREVVATGHGADQLERLVALKERVDANRAKEAFAVAMAACQKTLPAIIKDKENTQTRSRYATFDNILVHAKPVWTDHGFSISFGQADSPIAGWIRVQAIVRHVAGHSEPYFRDAPVDNKGMKGAENKTVLHGLASTVTYMSRQLVMGIFNITLAGSDKDGNAAPKTGLSDEQIITLREVLQAANVEEKAVLEWLQVGRIEDMTMGQYATAMAEYRGPKP